MTRCKIDSYKRMIAISSRYLDQSLEYTGKWLSECTCGPRGYANYFNALGSLSSAIQARPPVGNYEPPALKDAKEDNPDCSYSAFSRRYQQDHALLDAANNILDDIYDLKRDTKECQDANDRFAQAIDAFHAFTVDVMFELFNSCFSQTPCGPTAPKQDLHEPDHCESDKVQQEVIRLARHNYAESVRHFAQALPGPCSCCCFEHLVQANAAIAAQAFTYVLVQTLDSLITRYNDIKLGLSRQLKKEVASPSGAPPCDLQASWELAQKALGSTGATIDLLEAMSEAAHSCPAYTNGNPQFDASQQQYKMGLFNALSHYFSMIDLYMVALNQHCEGY